MKRKYITIFLLVIILLSSGCTQQTQLNQTSDIADNQFLDDNDPDSIRTLNGTVPKYVKGDILLRTNVEDPEYYLILGYTPKPYPIYDAVPVHPDRLKGGASGWTYDVEVRGNYILVEVLPVFRYYDHVNLITDPKPLIPAGMSSSNFQQKYRGYDIISDEEGSKYRAVLIYYAEIDLYELIEVKKCYEGYCLGTNSTIPVYPARMCEERVYGSEIEQKYPIFIARGKSAGPEGSCMGVCIPDYQGINCNYRERLNYTV
jgi:hypothetical protein